MQHCIVLNCGTWSYVLTMQRNIELVPSVVGLGHLLNVLLVCHHVAHAHIQPACCRGIDNSDVAFDNNLTSLM